MSLPEGLSALGNSGPAELRGPFARFSAAYQANGRFADCLDVLKGELADPVGDRICETVRVAREVGGSDLGSVLRTLSGLLRADARTRAELETRQGWVVNAAGSRWVRRGRCCSCWAPGATLQCLRLAAVGSVLLLIGGGVCVLAYRIMIRIGRLPEDRRVLR